MTRICQPFRSNPETDDHLVQDVSDIFLIRDLVTVAERGLDSNPRHTILQHKKTKRLHFCLTMPEVQILIRAAVSVACIGYNTPTLSNYSLSCLEVVTFLAFVQGNKRFGNFFQDQNFALISSWLNLRTKGIYNFYFFTLRSLCFHGEFN